MAFFERAPFAAFRGPVSPVLVRASLMLISCCGLGAASTPPVPVTSVLELFTSQGCSSCPPADALLATIARKPDIVAVSFPVDYWDYIGWKDTLAAGAFAARQRAYAAAHGEEHVYTPQAVIDGLVGVVGSDRQDIEAAIGAGKGRGGAVSLPMRLSHSDGSLVIDVAGGDGGPADVLALRVLRAKTVHIGRGENAGRVVTYTNVVRAIDKVGLWTGSMATFTLPESHAEDEGYVVLLQKGTLEKPGPILGAAKTAGL
ncbi:MAG: DUF1223 domain-containing protein [Methylocella sp.]